MDERRWKLKRPKGLGMYILETCQEPGYIFFSNKTGKANCTSCGKEWNISERYMNYEHNPEGPHVYQQYYDYCPFCQNKVLIKDKKYRKKKLFQEGFIIWLERKGKTTFVQKEHFRIVYDSGVPDMELNAVAQYKFSKEKIEMYRFNYYWYNSQSSWEPVKNVAYKYDEEHILANYKIGHYIYRPSLNNFGTDLKYADLKQFKSPYQLINYIKFFLMHQSIELLEKSGFKKIVNQRTQGHGCKQINWKAKKLHKILKCQPWEVKVFRRMEVDIPQLEAYRESKIIYPATTAENYSIIAEITNSNFYTHSRRCEYLEKYSSIEKAIDYLYKQQSDPVAKLSDYNDYLGFVEKLGLKMDKKTLHPEDFWKAHDKLEEQIATLKDQEDLNKFLETQKKFTRMERSFERGDYLIRPAENPAELRKESRVLDHCVRTYVSKICEGRTSILFIRKRRKPDQPLFTLEWDGKQTIQCRGKNNCSCPEDVTAFIKKWEIWMKNQSLKSEFRQTFTEEKVAIQDATEVFNRQIFQNAT